MQVNKSYIWLLLLAFGVIQGYSQVADSNTKRSFVGTWLLTKVKSSSSAQETGLMASLKNCRETLTIEQSDVQIRMSLIEACLDAKGPGKVNTSESNAVYYADERGEINALPVGTITSITHLKGSILLIERVSLKKHRDGTSEKRVIGSDEFTLSDDGTTLSQKRVRSVWGSELDTFVYTRN